MTNRRMLLFPPRRRSLRDNFADLEGVPALADGQVLVKHSYLSLDPYMRGRMNDAKSYAPPQPLNEVMIGGTAGEVVESRHPSFAAGDQVVGMGGWQEYSVVDGGARAIRKVDTSRIPLSGVSRPGRHAGRDGVVWAATRSASRKPGNTITVSAASGAVGSVVGQLAKAKGCRAIGFAGGPDKCRYVTDELGFDACIDYKAHAEPKALYARAEGGDT